MRVAVSTRDTLARIATEELGGVSLNEALATVLFEHESRLALARLASDPDELDSYRREATELADVDITVDE
jgi:hypothetical protein